MAHKAYGNTKAEYVIVGTVVLAITIFSVVLTGRNLDKRLQGLKGDLQNSAASAQAFQRKVVQERVANATVGRTTGATITVCTRTIGSQSICAEIPYQARQAIIQVAGSIGNQMTPEQFAALLNVVSNQLEPEESERIINKLIQDLANAGHAIASSQRELSFVCDYTGQCDINFNLSDEQFNRLNRREKNRIRQKLDELNRIKSMLDNALAAVPAALPDVNQGQINQNTAKTNDSVLNQNAANIGVISNTTTQTSNNTCSQQVDGNLSTCTR